MYSLFEFKGDDGTFSVWIIEDCDPHFHSNSRHRESMRKYYEWTHTFNWVGNVTRKLDLSLTNLYMDDIRDVTQLKLAFNSALFE